MFASCLLSTYSGILKRENFKARSIFASLHLFPRLHCLFLRRYYFILGRCTNSAIQRYTFKTLEQSGKLHPRKYTKLFTFYKEIGKSQLFASHSSFRDQHCGLQILIIRQTINRITVREYRKAMVVTIQDLL